MADHLIGRVSSLTFRKGPIQHSERACDEGRRKWALLGLFIWTGSSLELTWRFEKRHWGTRRKSRRSTTSEAEDVPCWNTVVIPLRLQSSSFANRAFICQTILESCIITALCGKYGYWPFFQTVWAFRYTVTGSIASHCGVWPIFYFWMIRWNFSFTVLYYYKNSTERTIHPIAFFYGVVWLWLFECFSEVLKCFKRHLSIQIFINFPSKNSVFDTLKSLLWRVWFIHLHTLTSAQNRHF